MKLVFEVFLVGLGIVVAAWYVSTADLAAVTRGHLAALLVFGFCIGTGAACAVSDPIRKVLRSETR